MRPIILYLRSARYLFQSTHPKRDETDAVPALFPYHTQFQSTHPKRDETVVRYSRLDLLLISIHSSQTGWDRLFPTWINTSNISIHSSQTGWDSAIHTNLNAILNFNPLIPNGMRLLVYDFDAMRDYISIHSSQTGWDRLLLKDQPIAKDFNPLIPNGMRPLHSFAIGQ